MGCPPKPELEDRTQYPKKRLGQHFLTDPNTARIVAEGVTKDDVVLEIGPGRGFLTGFLSERASRVHAIELDGDLLDALREEMQACRNVSIHKGDALTYDYASLEPAPNKLVANLPYNIASPLIIKFLEEHHCVNVMRFMVQYEVARRMVAETATKEYAAYAVLVQLLARVSLEHKVSPHVFYPPPRVHSAIVEVERQETGLGPADYEGVKHLVLTAFKSRRKQLVNNLPESARVEGPSALRRIGLSQDARAEELATQDFVALYRELSWAL
ncbi:16S rRNA (adenine(1518)-N(6)/adenine(1519)-N(6))-dimethyltransferaseRsmA [soil metagenome]